MGGDEGNTKVGLTSLGNYIQCGAATSSFRDALYSRF